MASGMSVRRGVQYMSDPAAPLVRRPAELMMLPRAMSESNGSWTADRGAADHVKHGDTGVERIGHCRDREGTAS